MQHHEAFGENAITQVNSGQDKTTSVHTAHVCRMRQELGTERKGTLLFIINFLVLFKFHFLLLLRACITFFFIYYFYNLKLFTFCLFGPWLATDDVVTSHVAAIPTLISAFSAYTLPTVGSSWPDQLLWKDGDEGEGPHPREHL